jgi:hypothetical protein
LRRPRGPSVQSSSGVPSVPVAATASTAFGDRARPSGVGRIGGVPGGPSAGLFSSSGSFPGRSDGAVGRDSSAGGADSRRRRTVSKAAEASASSQMPRSPRNAIGCPPGGIERVGGRAPPSGQAEGNTGGGRFGLRRRLSAGSLRSNSFGSRRDGSVSPSLTATSGIESGAGGRSPSRPSDERELPFAGRRRNGSDMDLNSG